MYNTLGIEIHPFKEKFLVTIPRIHTERPSTTTPFIAKEKTRMVRRKVTRLFRNNPDEYYLPNQCSSSNQQISNNISRGNEENLKRLRGLFVDFDKKRAEVTAIDLGHDEHISFRCEDCGEPFNNRMALKTHRIIKHIVQRVYECDSCRKMFAFKESLVVHKRTCVKEELKPVITVKKQKPEIKLNFMFDFSGIKVGGSSPSPDKNKSSLTCTDCGGSFTKKALLIWHQRHVCK